MKHNSSQKLVLENTEGRVIRSYHWDQPKFNLVKREDTGRVEAHADLQDLQDQEVPFSILKTVNTTEIRERGLSIPSVGRIRSVDEDTDLEFTESPKLIHEDNEEFAAMVKWSAIAHFTLLFLLLLGYWIHGRFIEEEPVVVKVLPQSIQKIVPKKVVKATKKKIDRTKKVGKSKTPVKKVVKKSKSVKSMGALAVLGGTSSGKKGGTGLNLNSNLNYSGSGDSSGTRSLGKSTSAMAGKGIFSRSGGGGNIDHGTVGYGTKGRAGGKAGYGSLNIGGAAGGYDHIIPASGSVSGGLEKSQIEAVINRNRGQIIYCYEKGLQGNPKLAGRVKMHWVIGGNGVVKTVQKKSSSLKSATVNNCISKKIKGWKFPKPHGNVNVNVTYPFNLKRANQR